MTDMSRQNVKRAHAQAIKPMSPLAALFEAIPVYQPVSFV